jgi:hypothetical protein
MDPITLIVTALAAGSSEGALEALKDVQVNRFGA